LSGKRQYAWDSLAEADAGSAAQEIRGGANGRCIEERQHSVVNWDGFSLGL